MIAEILKVRKQRLSLQREADLLEQQEKALTNDMINYMSSNHLNILTEEDDQVTLVKSIEPVATDWPALLDYIRENDALDILQKRLTPSAIKARWAENVEVPGIEPTDKYTVKFNV